MIWESWYWKQPLLKMAERLRDLKSPQTLSEEQLVQIEKDLFIGFYSVRKLFETGTKVTDSTKTKKVQITWYPNKKPVNWRNNHCIDELYALDQQHGETRDLWFVSGRIIHSFIFAPVVEDETGGLVGIFFTSDTDKDKKLYFMDIDTVIHVFELVGHDDPTTIEWKRNPETGEETTKLI
jgi:hypothetical protein